MDSFSSKMLVSSNIPQVHSTRPQLISPLQLEHGRGLVGTTSTKRRYPQAAAPSWLDQVDQRNRWRHITSSMESLVGVLQARTKWGLPHRARSHAIVEISITMIEIKSRPLLRDRKKHRCSKARTVARCAAIFSLLANFFYRTVRKSVVCRRGRSTTSFTSFFSGRDSEIRIDNLTVDG